MLHRSLYPPTIAVCACLKLGATWLCKSQFVCSKRVMTIESKQIISTTLESQDCSTESTGKNRVEPRGLSGVLHQEKDPFPCQSKNDPEGNGFRVYTSVCAGEKLPLLPEQKLLKKTDILKTTNASHYRIDCLVVS